MTTTADQLAETSSVELVIGGMTCASCAVRIEKKLNKLDGVSATVNYATEKAKVTYAGTVSPQDLVNTVEATGYTAALPAPKVSSAVAAAGEAEQGEKDDEVSRLRQRPVAGPDPGFPRRGMGRVPVPPRCVHQRPPRCCDDGHLDLGGYQRCVAVVVVGAVPWHCRDARHPDELQPLALTGECYEQHLSRSRVRGHRVDPVRSLLRGEGQEALRRCVAHAVEPGR